MKAVLEYADKLMSEREPYEKEKTKVVTYRDLFEMQETPAARRISARTNYRPRINFSPAQISLKALKIQRPALLKKCSNSYFESSHFLKTFMEWCGINEIDCAAGIDDQISSSIVKDPILDQFSKLAESRTGYSLSELIYGYFEDWDFDDEDNYLVLDAVFMPVYIDGYDDRTIFLEFIESCWRALTDENSEIPQFPECLYEGRFSDEQIGRAYDVFSEAIQNKDFSCFDEKWQKGLQALRQFDCSFIFCSDHECSRIEIDSPGDIDQLFFCAKSVYDMRDGVDDLYWACETQEFWDSLIERLLDYGGK
jgi:hypothetical protein